MHENPNVGAIGEKYQRVLMDSRIALDSPYEPDVKYMRQALRDLMADDEGLWS